MPWQVWWLIAAIVVSAALVIVTVRRGNQEIRRELRRAVWPLVDQYMEDRDQDLR